MRVILTHDITDMRALLTIGLVPVIAVFVHREEDAAVHRLQAVAHIGQRTAHDHAHGVVEIRPLHFLHDGNRLDVGRELAAAGSALLSQIRSRSLFGITGEFIAEQAPERQF
jgi:hypothetical protein